MPPRKAHNWLTGWALSRIDYIAAIKVTSGCLNKHLSSFSCNPAVHSRWSTAPRLAKWSGSSLPLTSISVSDPLSQQHGVCPEANSPLCVGKVMRTPPKGSLLSPNRVPYACSVMVAFFFDSSSSNNCWYAWDISNLVNLLPPPKVAIRSCLGNRVTLKLGLRYTYSSRRYGLNHLAWPRERWVLPILKIPLEILCYHSVDDLALVRPWL